MAGEGVGAAEGIGDTVAADHVPDEARRMPAGRPENPEYSPSAADCQTSSMAPGSGVPSAERTRPVISSRSPFSSGRRGSSYGGCSTGAPGR
jgi:hypothetical protein